MVLCIRQRVFDFRKGLAQTCPNSIRGILKKVKARRPKPSQENRTSKRKAKNLHSPKLIYEVAGPCGRMLVQARTPDQARGMYLAACPRLPRELGSIEIIRLVDKPTKPYLIIQHKRRNRPIVTLRFPAVQV